MEGTFSQHDVQKALQDIFESNPQHRLTKLRQEPANTFCCDCGASDPQWGSLSFGVLICIRCSGIHRSLGTHVSRVRSLDLDTWSEEQVAGIEVMGNEKFNDIYEAFAPKDEKPTPASPIEDVEAWVHSKYVEMKWKRFVPKAELEVIPEGHFTEQLAKLYGKEREELESAEDASATLEQEPELKVEKETEREREKERTKEKDTEREKAKEREPEKDKEKEKDGEWEWKISDSSEDDFDSLSSSSDSESEDENSKENEKEPIDVKEKDGEEKLEENEEADGKGERRRINPNLTPRGRRSPLLRTTGFSIRKEASDKPALFTSEPTIKIPALELKKLSKSDHVPPSPRKKLDWSNVAAHLRPLKTYRESREVKNAMSDTTNTTSVTPDKEASTKPGRRRRTIGDASEAGWDVPAASSTSPTSTSPPSSAQISSSQTSSLSRVRGNSLKESTTTLLKLNSASIASISSTESNNGGSGNNSPHAASLPLSPRHHKEQWAQVEQQLGLGAEELRGEQQKERKRMIKEAKRRKREAKRRAKLRSASVSSPSSSSSSPGVPKSKSCEHLREKDDRKDKLVMSTSAGNVREELLHEGKEEKKKGKEKKKEKKKGKKKEEAEKETEEEETASKDTDKKPKKKQMKKLKLKKIKLRLSEEGKEKIKKSENEKGQETGRKHEEEEKEKEKEKEREKEKEKERTVEESPEHAGKKRKDSKETENEKSAKEDEEEERKRKKEKKKEKEKEKEKKKGSRITFTTSKKPKEEPVSSNVMNVELLNEITAREKLLKEMEQIERIKEAEKEREIEQRKKKQEEEAEEEKRLEEIRLKREEDMARIRRRMSTANGQSQRIITPGIAKETEKEKEKENENEREKENESEKKQEEEEGNENEREKEHEKNAAVDTAAFRDGDVAFPLNGGHVTSLLSV